MSSKILKNVLFNRIKKNLSFGLSNNAGHNLYGRITVFSKGGGINTKVRVIDYNRIICSTGVVISTEYDLRHTGVIGCICYYIGLFVYVVLPIGFSVSSPWEGFIHEDWGTSNFLGNMPVGSIINNIEIIPGKGAVLARAAGMNAFVYAKFAKHVLIKLKSGILKQVSVACVAAYGTVSNKEHYKLNFRKAGISKMWNKRPIVRGVAMNPVDHPHGGGEGKKSQPRLPRTPWGNPGKWVKLKKNI